MSFWYWAMTVSLTAYGIGMIAGKNVLAKSSLGRRSGKDRRKTLRSTRSSAPDRRVSKSGTTTTLSKWMVYSYIAAMGFLLVVLVFHLVTE